MTRSLAMVKASTFGIVDVWKNPQLLKKFPRNEDLVYYKAVRLVTVLIKIKLEILRNKMKCFLNTLSIRLTTFQFR